MPRKQSRKAPRRTKNTPANDSVQPPTGGVSARHLSFHRPLDYVPIVTTVQMYIQSTAYGETGLDLAESSPVTGELWDGGRMYTRRDARQGGPCISNSISASFNDFNSNSSSKLCRDAQTAVLTTLTMCLVPNVADNRKHAPAILTTSWFVCLRGCNGPSVVGCLSEPPQKHMARWMPRGSENLAFSCPGMPCLTERTSGWRSCLLGG
jgi:hypothetical protein